MNNPFVYRQPIYSHDDQGRVEGFYVPWDDERERELFDQGFFDEQEEFVSKASAADCKRVTK